MYGLNILDLYPIKIGETLMHSETIAPHEAQARINGWLLVFTNLDDYAWGDLLRPPVVPGLSTAMQTLLDTPAGRARVGIWLTRFDDTFNALRNYIYIWGVASPELLSRVCLASALDDIERMRTGLKLYLN